MKNPVNRIALPGVDDIRSALDRARGGWWLWPARCRLCGAPGHARRDLCAACAAGLPWLQAACPVCALPLPPGQADQPCGRCLRRPPPQHTARAAFRYEGAVRRLLPRAKFHGDLAAIRLLADLMAQAWAHRSGPQALIPLPLHRSRLRQRGYDQALELARPLAERLQMRLIANRLVRQRATAAQSDLNATERRRNLRGAFAVAPGALPAHVAVFDDVMTTGATAHAAVRALHRAGVERVEIWVCARVA